VTTFSGAWAAIRYGQFSWRSHAAGLSRKKERQSHMVYTERKEPRACVSECGCCENRVWRTRVGPANEVVPMKKLVVFAALSASVKPSAGEDILCELQSDEDKHKPAFGQRSISRPVRNII